MNWLDILERTLWTFVQGAAGALVAMPILDFETAQPALMAALMGGIAAVIAFVKNVAKQRLEQKP